MDDYPTKIPGEPRPVQALVIHPGTFEMFRRMSLVFAGTEDWRQVLSSRFGDVPVIISKVAAPDFPIEVYDFDQFLADYPAMRAGVSS